MDGGVHQAIGKSLWILLLPEKVKVFSWLAYHNQILTKNILNKKGLQIDRLCRLYYDVDETVDHLLLNWTFFIILRSSVMQGICHPQLPTSITQLWEDWIYKFQHKEQGTAIASLHLTVHWMIRGLLNARDSKEISSCICGLNVLGHTNGRTKKITSERCTKEIAHSDCRAKKR